MLKYTYILTHEEKVALVYMMRDSFKRYRMPDRELLAELYRRIEATDPNSEANREKRLNRIIKEKQ